jgi:hypothetical protein
MATCAHGNPAISIQSQCLIRLDNENFGLDLSDLKNVNLPVVELPDGTRLFGPTLRDVADRLGFVAKPKLRQYDVSIYGAGPAGLSAAVYAASEGLSTVLIERSAVGGLACLAELGWLRPEAVRARDGGRPTVRFRINPRLLAGRHARSRNVPLNASRRS